MKIFAVNYNQRFDSKFNKSLNFKSTLRDYKSEQIDGRSFGNYSWTFRYDLNWYKLAAYILESFQNKDTVNLIQYASSDGSEAYTMLISLLECGNESLVKKFLPLKAFDIDPIIINAAKTNLINLTDDDVNELKKIEVFDKYFVLNKENLDIEDDVKVKSSKTYAVDEILSKNIDFNVGDMFKKVDDIKDNSNTILFCRNSLAYFEKPEIEKFVKKVNDKLNKNSLFVVGRMETTNMNFMNAMKECKFQEIMPCVFKKII